MSKYSRVCQKYVDIYARVCREYVANLYYYFFDAIGSRISDSIGSLIVFSRALSLYIDGFMIARLFVLEKSQSHKSVFRLRFVPKKLFRSLLLYIYIYIYIRVSLSRSESTEELPRSCEACARREKRLPPVL